MIPWSLLIGATYAVSAFFTLRLIGPEFTAIIAASITLIVAAFTALKGIGTPTSVWRSAADESESEDTTPAKIKHIPIWKAWLPYVIAIGLLLITRIIPIVKDFTVKNLDASWLNILGVEGISSTWAVLYSPGTILLLAAIAAALIGQRSLKPLATASRQSLKIVSGAMLALIPTLILVQIFSNSGFNTANLESMPVYIGRTLADLLGGLWVLCAPLLGTIGAFIAGSATVSNLTMGPVQESIAASTNLPLIIILSLQTIGGAAGNVIAIHNVVAASVVVGLDHREELIMRKLILPAIVYIIIAAILGTAAVYLL
ncbi:hypothetical protein CR969_00860 [Candidatus Saccharibacteria bacterium]|nr:MAG: hypothetical protein CR969_00860 [Candidatus Saccharibacteria bacterium]